jgi:hypothetical protein
MLLESTMQNDELVKVKDETLSDIRQRDDDRWDMSLPVLMKNCIRVIHMVKIPWGPKKI